jgi:hypothetical protein
MMANPPVFIARKSGLPVTPAEIAIIAVVAVVVFALQQPTMFAVMALLLGVFLYFGRWGSKPTLKCAGDPLEYRNGKVLATVKRSDISKAVIRGNRFVGRSLIVHGEIMVKVGDGKPVRRRSLVIPDVFLESLEDIRETVLSS